MSVIAQLTADILATPAAIVLFDTCAILDVARAPRSQSDAASAAMTLIALAKQTPPAIHLLAVDIVRNEWSDNIDSAEKDAESTVATYRKVAATISSLSSQPVPPEPPQLPTLPGTLRKLSLELLDACQVIDRDPTAMSAALDRVVKKKRPPHKKYVKDSYILEHCLALSSSLGGPTPECRPNSSLTHRFPSRSTR